MKRNYYLSQYHKGKNFSSEFDPNRDTPSSGPDTSGSGAPAGGNEAPTPPIMPNPQTPFQGLGSSFRSNAVSMPVMGSLLASGMSGYMEGRGGYDPNKIAAMKYTPYALAAGKFAVDLMDARGRNIENHLINAAFNGITNWGANKLGNYIGSRHAASAAAAAQQPQYQQPQTVPMTQMPAMPVMHPAAAHSFSRPAYSFVARKLR